MNPKLAQPLPPLAEEDLLRASVYGLISRLLTRSPDAAVLNVVRGIPGDDSELGRAFSRLAAKAANLTATAIAEEYQTLFIGIGRGELLPYGSYYLTGFLNEKPLARLRRSMAELGIARESSNKDPEDHVGALMEMMAGLINGEFGQPASLNVQKTFFNSHVGNWATYFFADLEAAKAADFYGPVGTIGRLFMAIEVAAFEMQ